MRRILSMAAVALCLASTPALAYGGFGGGFAGGIIGGLFGGVIGGYAAQPHYYPAPAPYYYDPRPVDPVDYCMRRFRSYNPRTGLYFGYDRQFHTCP